MNDLEKQLIRAMLNNAFALGKLYQVHIDVGEPNNAKTIKEDFKESIEQHMGLIK